MYPNRARTDSGKADGMDTSSEASCDGRDGGERGVRGRGDLPDPAFIIDQDDAMDDLHLLRRGGAGKATLSAISSSDDDEDEREEDGGTDGNINRRRIDPDHEKVAEGLRSVDAEGDDDCGVYVDWDLNRWHLSTARIASLKARLRRRVDSFRDDIDFRHGNMKCSVLDMAAANGFVDVMEEVIELGANVNGANPHGRTSLHCAALGNRPRAVSLLIRFGACVHAEDNGGWTPLHAASFCGSSDAAVCLLRSGADKDKLDSAGRPPIFLAIEYGHLAVTAALIANDADIAGQYGDDGYTALDAAAVEGHWEMIKMMIRFGANVNSADCDGVGALFLAAVNDNARAVDVLIEAGANIEVQDSREWTPLHAASAEGSSYAVAALLRQGANKEKMERRGNTPLHLAAENGRPDVVRVLLRSGADANRRVCGTFSQYSAMDLAALHSQKRHLDVLKALAELGGNVNAVDVDGSTALHVAAKWNKSSAIKVLVAAGADVEARQSAGRTPLHLAAAGGQSNAVLALTRCKADTSKMDSEGRTPLHLAAQLATVVALRALVAGGANINLRSTPEFDEYAALDVAASLGNVDTLEELIRLGADVNATDTDGVSALHVAVKHSQPKTIHALVNAGADVDAEDGEGSTPLHEAASSSSSETITALLENGADTSKATNDNRAPLHLAATHQNHEAVKTLLKNGADIHLRCVADGPAALDCAAAAGDVFAIRMLVLQGADVNDADSEGRTALISAVDPGKERAVEALAELGADLEAHPNDETWTPLHVASEVLHHKVVRALLKHGANANARDANNDNDTPLHIAARQAGMEGATEIVESLLLWGGDETATNDLNLRPIDVADIRLIQEGVTAADIHPVAEQLRRAPANRAWRRRGLLVLCWARNKRNQSTAKKKEGLNDPTRVERLLAEGDLASGAAASEMAGISDGQLGRQVKPRRPRSARVGGGTTKRGKRGAEPAGGMEGVAAWMVRVKEEGLVRTVVWFL